METIDANSASLSNYEAMLVLQQIKDSKGNKKPKKEGSLATVTYETLRYLQDSACKSQNEEQICKLLEALKPYSLTKTEKLMMVNTPPKTAIEIQLIVQESEDRLSESQVEKLLALILEIFPKEEE